MTGYRYPGLFGDPRSGRLWPAFLLSAILHVALFWSFTRFHIRPIDRIFYSPIQMVELAGTGSQRSARKIAEHRVATPKPPAPARSKPKSAPKPPARPHPPEKVQRPPKATPPPPSKVKALPAKPKPVPPAPKVEVPPKSPPKPPPPSKPAEQPAPRTVAKPKAPSPPPKARNDARVEELKRRIEEQRESALRSRIDSLKKELASSSKQQPSSQELAELQARIRDGQARTKAASDSGANATGIRASSGSILRDVRLRVYYDSLWESVRKYWVIPPSLEDRGYKVIVSVSLNRRGQIVDASGRTVDARGRPVEPHIEESSGSALFDKMAVQAIEVAASKGLLAIPEDIPEEHLEVGFKFDGK